MPSSEQHKHCKNQWKPLYTVDTMNKIQQNQLGLLQRGLDKLEIELSNAAQKQLILFLSLLAKWNKAYNLTAITQPEAMVSQHLLDSLAVHPYLSGEHIIDVGTGAGIPGIPLAIANPDRSFTLIDSNGKKTRFIQQILFELGINNISVVNKRVEEYQPGHCFDNVLSRAFASLADMIVTTKHLRCAGGRFLAMKGAINFDEIAAIETSFTVTEMRKLAVPGLEAERHLIIVEESHSG